jgi:hypothetical protein
VRARLSLISGGGARVDRDLDAFLTSDLRERSRVEANQFIKRLRLVAYGAETMRTRFTYRGESLWWFTELYLHKMRRIDTATSVVHALETAVQTYEPHTLAIESDDAVVQSVAEAFARVRQVGFERRGAAQHRGRAGWSSYVGTLTAHLSRVRPRRSRRPSKRPAIAAFVHSAFWRGRGSDAESPRSEHYIGPVLAALTTKLRPDDLAYVGLGPRRNFRARRWWDPLTGSPASPRVAPIEGLAPFAALRESRTLWQRRRELGETLTGGEAIRAAATFRGVDLWAVLRPELEATAALQWPWAARAMDEAAAALDALSPDVMLTYAEAGGWGRALILEARRRGMRSVGLQHGFIYRHWLNYLHEPDELQPAGDTPPFPLPDRTLVFDRLTAGHLHDAGRFPPDAVEVTGSPRLDELAARIRSISPAERRAMRQRLGAKDGEPLAMLAAKHSEIQGDVPALRAALESKPHVRLAIKPHPAETPEVYAPLAQGLPNVSVASSDSDLAQMLTASDLIVTRNSTVAVDGLALGVPALVFGLPNNLSPFVDAGAMAGAGDATELADQLESLLYNQGRRDTLAEAGRAFVSQAGLIVDGRAADRTADAILALRRAVT